MKKRRYWMIFTCFFLFLNIAGAHTFYINPVLSSSDINNILKIASPGDSIIFRSGHYFINDLLISKALILKGEDFPILDGVEKFQILTIKADDVTIDGFKLINSGSNNVNDISAIRIENARNVTIKNNILLNVCFGIQSMNVSHCLITNNKINSHAEHELQSGNGIHCWKCDSMFINKNFITGQRDGIYFEFVTNSYIENNISEKNLRYGMHFMFSHHNVYSGNIFNFNGAGVAVMYSHNVTMLGNTFCQNQGETSYGILMKEITDSHVKGNHFTKNSIGIYMEGTSRILVEKNTFESNGWAFKIQASCADIQVENNMFIGNTFDVATNGTLMLNKFVNNYWDKYEGYDLNKDGIGDIPYRPVSLYSIITERMPYSIMLFRSFMVMLLERTEKAVPGLTPVDLRDDKPLMKPISL